MRFDQRSGLDHDSDDDDSGEEDKVIATGQPLPLILQGHFDARKVVLPHFLTLRQSLEREEVIPDNQWWRWQWIYIRNMDFR